MSSGRIATGNHTSVPAPSALKTVRQHTDNLHGLVVDANDAADHAWVGGPTRLPIRHSPGRDGRRAGMRIVCIRKASPCRNDSEAAEVIGGDQVRAQIRSPSTTTSKLVSSETSQANEWLFCPIEFDRGARESRALALPGSAGNCRHDSASRMVRRWKIMASKI